jgi:hypothetical protein
MACAAWGTAPALAAISITETDADSLRYATAPGWTMDGIRTSPTLPAWQSHLTVPAPVSDPNGQGWLRLTQNQSWQSGMAVYNTAFSSTEGLQITFDYASHSASHLGLDADWLSFYLIDGNTTNPTVGGHWGYHRKGSVHSGGTNNYVGIALDSWDDCNAAYPALCNNSDRVVVRSTAVLTAVFPLT